LISATSFRDPDGRVFVDDRSVWRSVNESALPNFNAFLELPQSKAAKLIETEIASPEETKEFESRYGAFHGALFKHPRIDFPSFPYEWAPEMLQAAGLLTLDLAEAMLPVGWGIKDGTPYNVLFNGSDPKFIDVLSFEKRAAADPIWVPYNQFVKTFILPLLVNKRLGIPLKQIFQANRDGLEVSEASQYFGALARLKPQIFSMVTLPSMLVKRAESKSDLYQKPRKMSESQAKFILGSSFKRLRSQLNKVAPDPSRHSKWTDYTDHNRDTIPEYMRAKRSFVETAVDELKPPKVLDVGCNTGYFSFFAARGGASVVALDHDPAVVGKVWRDAKDEKLDVLPLVVDLTRPSPALGWRYSEFPSFLDRAAGHFDLVMMLAVIHHIIVQERVPLREVLRLAADLTKDSLIIEFVPPSDPLFRHLARGREHLHADLNEDVFKHTAEEFFSIVRSEKLPQTERSLYLMRKK
jgi:SAM-dependent methyltransferase